MEEREESINREDLERQSPESPGHRDTGTLELGS